MTDTATEDEKNAITRKVLTELWFDFTKTKNQFLSSSVLISLLSDINLPVSQPKSTFIISERTKTVVSVSSHFKTTALL